MLGADKVWDGKVGSLETLLGVSRTEAMVKFQEVTGLDAVQGTQLLWDTYHPHLYTWLPFAAIGVAAIIALVIFSERAKRWADMDA